MRLTISVKTRSRQDALGQAANGTWKASLKAVPEQGKANQALIKLVAKHFSVPQRNVAITTGSTSRTKTVVVAPRARR